MKLGVGALLVAWTVVAPAAGQQFTARFFTDTGRPFDGKQILFSPSSAFMAVLVADDRTHIYEVATGRETQNISFQPVAMAFAANSLGILAVAEQETKFVPVMGDLGLNVTWRPPQGYLGITFGQESGKILITALAAGGPAAQSGAIQLGDELVGLVVDGEEESVLGRTIPDVLIKLAGMPGSFATLRIISPGAVEPKQVKLRRVAGTKQANQITFRPSATRSAVCSLVVRYQHSLLVFDATEAELISAIQPQDVHPFGMFAKSVGFLSLSPDGKLLAITAQRRQAPRDEPEFGLEVFDVARQERLLFAPIDARDIYQQCFTADGKRILWGVKDRILVYDLEKRAFAPPLLIGFDPSLYKPQSQKKNDEEFSPLNLGLRATNLNPRMEREAAEAAKRVEYPEQLLAACDISPDGKMVAVGSCRGELRLFATGDHKELAKIGERSLEESLVKPVKFSPDGKWLAYYKSGTLYWQSVSSILAEHRLR